MDLVSQLELFEYLKIEKRLRVTREREVANALDRVKTQFPKTINCWEWAIDALGKLQDTSRLKSLYKDTDTIGLMSDREWVRTRLVKELARLESQQRPGHKTINEFLKKIPLTNKPRQWSLLKGALITYALA